MIRAGHDASRKKVVAESSQAAVGVFELTNAENSRYSGHQKTE
jgi:hypothetical protein